jgi:hypothetical protein
LLQSIRSYIFIPCRSNFFFKAICLSGRSDSFQGTFSEPEVRVMCLSNSIIPRSLVSLCPERSNFPSHSL